MTSKEIHTNHVRIHDSLDQRMLKPAFDLLQGFVSGTQSYLFQNKLNELQETYQYMLRYYVEGTDDPMREQIYASICSGAYELADRIKHHCLYIDSPQIYYATRRNLSINPTELATYIQQIRISNELEDHKQDESSVDQLFNRLWTTAFLSEKDVDQIRIALKDNLFPSSTKCQILSAFLLALQGSFDKEKVFLLFDAADSEDTEVRIRAIIAICLTLYIYHRRIPLYSGIRHRLEILGETPDFKRVLTTIIVRFILSRETEKVTHKLQEEIIPEMMKLAPKGTGFGFFDPSDLSGDDMNPEWKELLSDSKLAQKMEEYGNLQEEGVDVLHSTFIHLKNFPFFKQVSNWFLPFNSKHSILGDKLDINVSTLETIMQASFMCNSDKYSLYFSMFQIPKEHRDAMLTQLNSQLKEMNVQKASELKSNKSEVEIIAGKYIQDLYRFHKLYPRHAEFHDIFSRKLDFHNLDVLQPYCSDSETLLHISELYLRKGYYEDALTIYNQLVSRNPNDEMLLQKRGYCKQMTDDLSGALDDYLHSEMLNPNSKWLIRRIAGCYRSLKQTGKALEFYLRLDTLSPNNISTLISIGHCYLEQKSYDEALGYYFKADYLDSENQKVWRAIAWCLFLTGKYSQARKYFKKILDNQPQTHDFLNAGHTEWALQRIKKAIGYYQKAIEAESGDFNKFLELFRQDISCLENAGVKSSEIPLMIDYLRYGNF